jgi:hypothetical protein
MWNAPDAADFKMEGGETTISGMLQRDQNAWEIILFR